MKIFFTSDLHFGHRNILKFSANSRGHWETPEEMDEALINHWNSLIGKRDVVYNLGDFSFYKDINKVKEVLRRLKGKHHFILGNHDQLIEQHAEELLNETKADGNKLLESINHYSMISVGKSKIALFHYPIFEWDRGHHGAFHFYGHIHDRIADVNGRALNVGYDLHNRILQWEDAKSFVEDLPVIAHHNNIDLKNHKYLQITQEFNDTKIILVKEHLKNLNKHLKLQKAKS